MALFYIRRCGVTKLPAASKVCARAEMLAFRTQDSNAATGIVIEVIEGVRQCTDHRQVKVVVGSSMPLDHGDKVVTEVNGHIAESDQSGIVDIRASAHHWPLTYHRSSPRDVVHARNNKNCPAEGREVHGCIRPTRARRD